MSGDFVAFLDSDDAYQPDCIEKMMNAMSREDLRNKIIETGNKIGIENCGKRTKIAYWIFLKCPCLLKPAYLFVWPLLQKLKFLLCKCLGD